MIYIRVFISLIIEAGAINLQQEQTAFIVLRANRRTKAVRTSIILETASKKTGTPGEPFDDLVDSILEKVAKSSLKEVSQNDNHSFSKTAIAINSILILYWKVRCTVFMEHIFDSIFKGPHHDFQAITDKNGVCVTIRGQHHVPVFRLGPKYVSNVDALSQVEPVSSPSSLSVHYNRTFAINELVSVKMKHVPYVTHSFSSSR